MLVKWVHFTLLDAEELGLASDNIDEALASAKPEVRRLVGLDGKFGEELGLSNDWAGGTPSRGKLRRDLRAQSRHGFRLGIPRGMNQLWSLGGIQYAPPIR